MSDVLKEALSLHRAGQWARAAGLYQSILAKKPDDPDALHLLGVLHHQQGRHQQAVQLIEKACALRPGVAHFHANLAEAFRALGQLERAADSCRAALRLRPDLPEVHNNLGLVLLGLGRHAEAVEAFRHALRLRPGFPEAHNNLGDTLRREGRLDEAEAALGEALRLRPGYPEANSNLGIVRMRQGRIEEALAQFTEAVRVAPEYAEAHCNRALCLLMQGHFTHGWPEYEWRWRMKGLTPRAFARPRWDGGPLAGKKVLLYTEQGIGDTLQFIRYARLVGERGGVVLVEAPSRLLPLLRTCPGIDSRFAAGGPLPDFDVQAPLLSLPGLFGTTLETVPAGVPYLSAEPERVRRWGEELRAVGGFKVGIAWQGSPTYGNDRNRSIPPQCFEPLARLPGVRLVSLQKGPGAEQLAAVPRDWGVVDLAPRLDEDGAAFLDTAAVMACLDLVVTADTAVGHLAGALGVPVWVALPDPCDWRWLLGRTDSPWYPTLRLFRQRRGAGWDEVFARMAEELRRRLTPTAPPAGATELRRQAAALAGAGRLREAVECLGRAVHLEPSCAAAHAELGLLLCREGRQRDALPWLKRAADLEPQNIPYATLLGNLYRELGESPEGIPCWERVLAADPGRVDAHLCLGWAFQEAGRSAEAMEDFRTAWRLRPDSPAALVFIGGLHEELGEMAEAESVYREALRLQPTFGPPHARLAKLLGGKLPEADLRALEERLAEPHHDREVRLKMLFGLAHVLDGRGDHPRAAEVSRRANALSLEHARPYDPAQHAQFVEQTRRIFDRDFFARKAGLGLDTRRPVFIVGLPRSGSTLVEQVLAGHPQVRAAGEVRLVRLTFDAIPAVLGRPGPALDLAAHLDGPAVRRLAEGHLERLRALDGGQGERLVDKMLDNYQFLGLLAVLFPRAAIIHCKRDLRDTALSCWMTDFATVPWASSPEHIGSRFHQYLRLMAHWKEVLPVPIHQAVYEEMVEDLEGNARRLIAACGLEWHPACLAFHETRRAVRTASVVQVRQPVYKKSVARWKNYETHLADLFAALPPE